MVAGNVSVFGAFSLHPKTTEKNKNLSSPLPGSTHRAICLPGVSTAVARMDQGKPVLLIAPDLPLKDLEQTRFGIILGTPSEGEDPSPPREAELTLELYSCGRLFAARPLSLTMRSGFGDAVKELLCGFSTNSAKDKDMGVQRSHSWEPVKMQAQPRQKVERDAAFTRQKAQRASFRAHLREKYNLPKPLQPSP
ncbi:uncharacterized protein LOC116519864 isoform X2 [Thamnophis elegans]|uniref:uncharacterized protein LOC116519864 isoform X2 n=1 Tax=Thamnophis elegans TaxID=35005 RepID=UPI001376A786|nr:uncharacterized protein LOC116519864 isoform X2 [Thamnophis elegans]